MSISNRVLTTEQVNRIRKEQLLKLYTDTNIASHYNVSRKTVYNIRTAKRYANVPLPTVKKFANYAVYPTGSVVSKKTGATLTPRNGKVRLKTTNGSTVTIAVSDLVKTSLAQV